MLERALDSELVAAVVKGIIAVGLVGAVVYSVVTGQEISGEVLELIIAVLGVYFGFEAGRSWVARS